ncbi:metallophosphoesterase [Halobellus sp. Atlit-31R]|nr:metallophosphoesterase [Halobellus sp. Atlit-31R]
MDHAQFRSRSLFLPNADTLVLSDLHVGRSEASDVAFPLGERRDLVERLEARVAETDPSTVVFAGDVLHRFGTVTDRSRETVSELASACRDAGSEVVFVRGNHDAMLDSIREDVRDAYVVGDEPRTVVCHGHAEPPLDAELYVVGHDHPAIEIEGQRRPCFLHAPAGYREADVLMLPAFSRLAAGVEINGARAADLQSPLIGDLGSARPIVYDDGTDDALTFPPLSSFRRML